MVLYAGLRHKQLTFGDMVESVEKHGRREGNCGHILPVETACIAGAFDDETGRLKSNLVRTVNLKKSAKLDVKGAYNRFLKHHKVRPAPQSKKPILHVVAYVSKEACVGHGGDVKPEVMYTEAVKWAQKRYNGAVFHARCDLDEEGSPAVVDLLLAPIESLVPGGRRKKGEPREPKPMVSPRAAHERIAKAHGHTDPRKACSVNQDDWAAHMRNATQIPLQRGRPKRETGREHLHHSAYKLQKDQDREVENLALQARLDEMQERLEDMSEDLEANARSLSRLRKQMAKWREVVRAIRLAATREFRMRIDAMLRKVGLKIEDDKKGEDERERRVSSHMSQRDMIEIMGGEPDER